MHAKVQEIVAARRISLRSVEDSAGLPPDIGFLLAYGVSLSTLRRAQHRAEGEGTSASDCLLAYGGVSGLLFYKALACHLGLTFVQSGITLEDGSVPASALRTGRVRLGAGAPARWLMAPRGRALRLLLNARARGFPMPGAILMTPARFATLVRRAAGAAIAHDASETLPLRDPALSAKTIGGSRLGRRLVFVALGLLAATIGAPLPFALIGGLFFFVAISFRLILCAAGCVAEERATPLSDAELPAYSVLVPLHREAGMVPTLIAALDRIDYPRSKLEVLILVEHDDTETQLACLSAGLAPHYEIVVVPPASLRTKPRALNAALASVRGRLITVFDAEDSPDPQQLRQAAAHFRHAPRNVACLQARLEIGNGREGLLPHLFRLEYAALFDVFNPGIAQCDLPMALGGTSNHFRIEALKHVDGWDAYNVTEDADLGLRLARFGYRTESLASVTSEEAPVRLKDWVAQRRRWTKGWMQTALVLGRHPLRLYADLGGMKMLSTVLLLTTLVIGPLAAAPLTIIAALQLALVGGPDLHTASGVAEATLWSSVLLSGLGLTLWPAATAARRRRIGLTPWTLAALLPYQALIGIAAWGGLLDLVRKPHHWRKTPHGQAGATIQHQAARYLRKRRGLDRISPSGPSGQRIWRRVRPSELPRRQ